MIESRRLTGRCSNGYERDGGTQYHAVEAGSARALCGATPGRRSAGWSDQVGTVVTCPRCHRKMAERQPAELAGALEALIGACWDDASGALLRPQLSDVAAARVALATYRARSAS